MPNYQTFHVPGIDAGVSLALDGNRLALCLMAKGRARNKDGSYTVRNPQRLALLRHLLEHIRRDGAAFAGSAHFSLTHSKGGASASPWNEHKNGADAPGASLVDTLADMRRVYSKAGNFRVDYQLAFKGRYSLEHFAVLLGLEPADNRRPPRDVRFYGGA